MSEVITRATLEQDMIDFNRMVGIPLTDTLIKGNYILERDDQAKYTLMRVINDKGQTVPITRNKHPKVTIHHIIKGIQDYVASI